MEVTITAENLLKKKIKVSSDYFNFLLPVSDFICKKDLELLIEEDPAYIEEELEDMAYDFITNTISIKLEK